MAGSTPSKLPDSPPGVAILLGTYQGQQFLAEQLASFAAQTWSHWRVWASDDGSSDNTLSILQACQAQWADGRLDIRRGPRAGFAANFLSLVACDEIEADYYAFSDQDDVWMADKLERAVDWLSSVPAHIPALYCSRTRYVDADNQDIGDSPLYSRPPAFANALVQNIASGNTMVFNQAARALLRKASAEVVVDLHDWLAYLVVTACGGQVFYDVRPSVRYRQHGSNLIGMNSSWLAQLARIRMMMQGRFQRWNETNIKALTCLRGDLTEENQARLTCFSRAREQSLLLRLAGVLRAGVYRQTLWGNLGLMVAAILRRM